MGGDDDDEGTMQRHCRLQCFSKKDSIGDFFSYSTSWRFPLYLTIYSYYVQYSPSIHPKLGSLWIFLIIAFKYKEILGLNLLIDFLQSYFNTVTHLLSLYLNHFRSLVELLVRFEHIWNSDKPLVKIKKKMSETFRVPPPKRKLFHFWPSF